MRKAQQARKLSPSSEMREVSPASKPFSAQSQSSNSFSGMQSNGAYIAPLIPHPSLLKKLEPKKTENQKKAPRAKKVLSPEEIEKQDSQLLFKAWVYLFILVVLGLVVSTGILH